MTQTSSTSVTPTPQRPSSSKRNLQSQRRNVANPELQEAGKQMKEAFSVLSNVLSTRSDRMECKEDECDLYGKLLAQKLRKLPEREREEVMYEIDGLMLQKSRSRNTNVWSASSPSPVASLYCASSPTQENEQAAHRTTMSSPIVSPCFASPPIEQQNPQPRFTILRTHPTINNSIQAHHQPASKVQILSNQILRYDYNRALAVDVTDTDHDYSLE